MAAYVYVVEFQKRGLPHAHFLIILKLNSKLIASKSFDAIVYAEILAIIENEILYLVVTRHMMHDPCGYLNLNNVSMKKKWCMQIWVPKTLLLSN